MVNFVYFDTIYAVQLLLDYLHWGEVIHLENVLRRLLLVCQSPHGDTHKLEFTCINSIWKFV